MRLSDPVFKDASVASVPTARRDVAAFVTRLVAEDILVEVP